MQPHVMNKEMCKMNNFPLADYVPEKELKAVCNDVSQIENSLACRLKVVFMGECGSGKTSLVLSLLLGAPQLADGPTESVNTSLWCPFKEQHAEKLLGHAVHEDDKGLMLDLWDLTGRQICQGVHQLYLTEGSLFVVLVNVVDRMRWDSVTANISAIQAKAPGSVIIVAATRADQLFTEEARVKARLDLKHLLLQEKEKAEKDIQEEIVRLTNLGADPKILAEIDKLERLLSQRPKVADEICTISCLTGKGFDEFRKLLLRQALDKNLFPHQLHDTLQGTICLHNEILQLQNCGSYMLDWAEYNHLAFKDHRLSPGTVEEETEFLQRIGVILHLKSTGIHVNEQHYICIHPAVFAKAACLLHVDNPHKLFRIESKRFWPQESFQGPPDPSDLARILEEIPMKGLVREFLCPVLWQEVSIGEVQVKKLLEVLVALGILSVFDNFPIQAPNLSLPGFPKLSTGLRYSACLMNLAPNIEPQLNWTPRPFMGDIQLNWQYQLPSTAPPGVAERLILSCKVTNNDATYVHCWRKGTLYKIHEGIICVCHRSNTDIHLCCRVNADEEGLWKQAVELLWTNLVPFIHTAQHFLETQWPGLVIKTNILAMGHTFYTDQAHGSKEQAFPLSDIFIAEKTRSPLLLTTEAGDREVDVGHVMVFPVEEWISSMMTHAEDILAEMLLGSEPMQEFEVVSQKSATPTSCKKDKKDKILCIKWDLCDHDKNIKRSTSSLRSKPDSIQSLDINESQQKQTENNLNDKVISLNETSTESLLKKIGVIFTEEDEIREATKLANSFVASIMAVAAADFIQELYEDNHTEMKRVITEAQVTSARAIAMATQAVQNGPVDAAARAIMEALRSSTCRMLPSQSSLVVKKAKSAVCIVL